MEHVQKKAYQHRYFRSQCDICYESELFTDKHEQGSKIIMLFAEIFSYVCRIYGLSGVVSKFTAFSNTAHFKKWFWKVKYLLGESLQQDPDQHQIGEWLGKGLFLKITLNFILYNNLCADEEKCLELICKQLLFLHQLQGKYTNWPFIFYYEKDSYILLGEKSCLNYWNSSFFDENLLL